MSLQLAAQHMASRGRGPDSTLVHMAPQEVAGLQALAKAHGGSLTTNPDTGLPEAGFLSSILPMVIGAGITAATGGAAAPWMVGLGVGGAQALATGSLQKGLLAGMGAYGGAGLAGGLLGAGAAEAGLAGIAPGTSGTTAAMSGGFGGGSALAGTEAAGAALGTEGTTAAMSGGFGGGNTLAAAAPAPSAIQAQQAVMSAAPQTVTQAPTFSSNLSQMGQGIQNLGSEAGRDAFMSKTGVDGVGGLLKYGYAAGMPLLMQGPKQQAEKAKDEPYRYDFSYNPVADVNQGYTGAYTGERTHLNPVYTRTAAGGGLMDIGPVEAMSQANQSQMTPAYARGGASDTAVNPYTGAETFAEGGETSAVKPVEQDPYYTMSGQSGDAFKYLMGQGAKPTPAAAPVAAPAPAAAPVYEARTGGEWVNDTSGNIKPYTFDPATGTFAAAPVPKVWQPFAVATPMQDVGGSGDYGGYGMSNSGEGGGMSNSGEGGGAAGEGGWAAGGIASLAQGGQSHLGDYSDGGRLLRGPGDGVSDDIPATIGNKRPARLADGEFVVPARIVSELGNGSTEAGARQLYAMMDRVQKARTKTTGKNRVAANTKAEKLLPA